MPLCDASYDVVLFDGRCVGYSHGIPKTGEPLPRARLDYLEERLPDDFDEPGPLLAARFVAGETPSGDAVTECRPRHARASRTAHFLIGRSGMPHRVTAHHRRSLRWQWIEPDPPIDDSTDWTFPP